MNNKRQDIIDIDKALTLKKEDVIRNYKEHINPALVKMFSLLNFDKQFVEAQGTKILDDAGNEYLDFLGGYGALNFGHNPPEILAAVRKVEGFPNILQAAMGKITSAAARNLASIVPGDLTHSFFGNSGAEAVEGAIKLARAASGKEKIIYCQDSFHGKTMGALSITGRKKYQQNFSPLLPATEMVPYGDLESLEFKLDTSNVAAFILEPIQGEGGIIVPPDGYLRKVRSLCDKYETLMIVDEIQTGLGRTGNNFACQEDNILPDIMCVAKSLGGGVMPVGAFITRKEIWNKAYGSMDKALLHTSTFGGNAMAAAAAVEAINQLYKLNLSQEAKEKGEYFLAALKEMKEEYELLADVRGKGLMIGIEFKQPEKGILDKISRGMVSKLSAEYMGSMIAGALLNDYQIITAYTLNNPNVIRLEPPLIVDYKEIDWVLESLDSIFNKYNSFFDVTLNSAKTVFGNLFKS